MNLQKNPLKVLLINTPKRVFFFRSPVSRWFPLGLAYIGGAVKNAGYDIRVLDAVPFPESTRILNHEEAGEIGQFSRPGVSTAYHLGLSWDRIAGEINSCSPDVVGLSSLMTAHRSEVIHIARMVKRYSCNTKVVVGGPDAAMEPHRLLESGVVDYVVRGDGEKVIVHLLDRMSRHEDVSNLEGLAGIHDGNLFVNKITRLGNAEIDKIFPAYDLFPMEQWFKAAGMRFAMIIASRGCGRSCTFCSQRKTPFRVRSVQSVMAEINRLVENYGIDTLLFEDDMLLHDRQYAMELFESIAGLSQKMNIHCLSGVSVEHYDLHLAQTMKAAGMKTIAFGFETQHRSVQIKIKKTFASASRVREAVEWSRQAGIPDVRVFVIAGLPGTNMKNCLDDIEFVLRQGARPNLNCYYAVRGTPLYDFVFEKGYIVSGNPVHSRSSFCNIDLPDFPRSQLVKLLDYYHSVKILLGFSHLAACLRAFGINAEPRKKFLDHYTIITPLNGRYQAIENKFDTEQRYCLHFAHRLALWFSVCSDFFYRAEELNCGIADGASRCVFSLTRTASMDEDLMYIVSRLRKCYKYFKKEYRKDVSIF